MRILLPAIAGTLMAAAAFVPGVMSKSDPSLFTCDIRMVSVNGGVEVEPTVTAKTDLTGEYELQVRSSGSGGTSNSTQSGEFTAKAGQPVVLSQAMVGSGGSVSARLTVHANGATSACERTK